MVVIRLDRRVFYGILGALGVLLALVAGIMLGRGFGSSNAPVAAGPQAQPNMAAPQPNVAAPAQGKAAAPNVSGPTVVPQSDLATITRASIDESRKKLDQGSALLVDVRTAGEYQQGHIKGARHIPVNEMATRFNELPRDKELVLYCA